MSWKPPQKWKNPLKEKPSNIFRCSVISCQNRGTKEQTDGKVIWPVCEEHYENT